MYTCINSYRATGSSAPPVTLTKAFRKEPPPPKTAAIPAIAPPPALDWTAPTVARTDLSAPMHLQLSSPEAGLSHE